MWSADCSEGLCSEGCRFTFAACVHSLLKTFLNLKSSDKPLYVELYVIISSFIFSYGSLLIAFFDTATGGQQWDIFKFYI